MAPERAPDDFIFKRMTLGLCAGAVVGLLFAIVVAYLRGIEFSSVPVANHPELWPAALGYAVSKSAPMVAIYMTIASISLLREENLVSAAFAILIVMIVFALVGEGFIAPLSPLWLDASIGFWVDALRSMSSEDVATSNPAGSRISNRYRNTQILNTTLPKFLFSST